MSPLVRKNAKGHCSEPSFRRVECVGQPEYPTGENGPLSQLPLQGEGQGYGQRQGQGQGQGEGQSPGRDEGEGELHRP